VNDHQKTGNWHPATETSIWNSKAMKRKSSPPLTSIVGNRKNQPEFHKNIYYSTFAPYYLAELWI
jgi:hypothetical protein